MVEAIPVNSLSITVGWFLLTVFVTCNTYLLYRVLRNFQENPDYASARFFVDNRVRTAFRYMTVTAALYAITAAARPLQNIAVEHVDGFQYIVADATLEQISMWTSVVLYAVLVWAYYRFGTVSAKPHHEN